MAEIPPATFLFGSLLLFAQVAAPADPVQEAPAEFYHDFRRGSLPPQLKPLNADNPDLVRFDPGGLRITIPNTVRPPWVGIGVLTSFGIRGDFEITATVEVLKLQKPPKGTNAGVGIYVRTERAGANLRRLVAGDGTDKVIGNRHFQVPGKKAAAWRQEGVPCSDATVRLRLKRVGPMLHYFWAPLDPAAQFQPVYECEFGTDDIDLIRLTAGSRNSDPGWDIDARLVDVRIRQGEVPATEKPAASLPGSPPESSSILLWVVVGLGLFLGLGTLLVLFRRTRRRHDPAPSGSSATALAMTFPCSGCGTNLKVRPELVGKKVKCPQCGQAVAVPSS